MLQSIVEDIKGQFRYGNMITRIILVNIFVFLLILIVKAFSPPQSGTFKFFFELIVLSSEGMDVLKKPWTIITYMFVHKGFWHIGWNMILLYWFGRITGDLAGDRRILPLYLLGGLAGAVAYFMYIQVTGIVGTLHGASAGVTCIIVAAAFLAPDYNIRLLFLGNVKLKYIALVLIIMDLAMISENDNAGGRMAHLGGALMGGAFVHFLRQGRDITSGLQQLFFPSRKQKRQRKPARMTVIQNKKWSKPAQNPSQREEDVQQKIDQILDKINATGYDSLSKEEKEFLYQASQNQD